MTHLLDTNVFSDLAGRRESSVRARFEGSRESSLAVSTVTIAELEYGEAKAQLPSRSLAALREMMHRTNVLPFEQRMTPIYGKIRADLERRGCIIGANDLLIAATAPAYNLVLVTRDIDEFSRVRDLEIEDWSI